MSAINILWVDDEIELLRPHIIFLEKRGYSIYTATNADDALDMIEGKTFDLVFLDENMPGLRGLEALIHIKELAPDLPVVMVTKSEEEDIMDRAVGAKIADYLIKPVNPHQMLMSIKRLLHGRELATTGTVSAYQHDYTRIASQANEAKSWEEWKQVHKALCDWRLSLLNADTTDMLSVHSQQQKAANSAFAKYIRREYANWFNQSQASPPLLSPRVLKEKVFPLIDAGERVLLLVIDNLRYDQWRMIRQIIAPSWRVEDEDLYCAILPTVTQYARNSFFAGLMPLEIRRLYPDLWISERDDEGKNIYEAELLRLHIDRLGKKYRTTFYKGVNLQSTPLGHGDYSGLRKDDLTVLVYNFVDMLSHSRHDMDIVRQLANDAHGYLSLTESWFKHSDLYEFLKKAARLPIRLIVTTDHGSIQVNKAIKVIGNRETTTNLRYKMGKNLAYNPKEVYDVEHPETIGLPRAGSSYRFIFAPENGFFVYPNNFNQYVRMYRDSFQHGGVSLEEMLVPIVSLSPIG